ncbi:hypothetical protein R3P38DRAFT_3171245 [Favolaschia claudopus]|uniref:Uncharacterized protein n=1 Tax=Favolaschia claudopus TaxID=2862362 RepID=A0AAW0DQB8_9AGAR
MPSVITIPRSGAIAPALLMTSRVKFGGRVVSDKAEFLPSVKFKNGRRPFVVSRALPSSRPPRRASVSQPARSPPASTRGFGIILTPTTVPASAPSSPSPTRVEFGDVQTDSDSHHPRCLPAKTKTKQPPPRRAPHGITRYPVEPAPEDRTYLRARAGEQRRRRGFAHGAQPADFNAEADSGEEALSIPCGSGAVANSHPRAVGEWDADDNRVARRGFGFG